MKLRKRYEYGDNPAIDVRELVLDEIGNAGNPSDYYRSEGELEEMRRHIRNLQQMFSTVVGLAVERNVFTAQDIEKLLPDYEVVSE